MKYSSFFLKTNTLHMHLYRSSLKHLFWKYYRFINKYPEEGTRENFLLSPSIAFDILSNIAKCCEILIFLRWWLCGMLSYGMRRRVVYYKFTSVSNEYTASSVRFSLVNFYDATRRHFPDDHLSLQRIV